MGKDKEALEDFNEATKDFNKAIKIKPNYAAAFLCRATIYGKLGKYKKAIKDFKKAIKIYKDNENLKLIVNIAFAINKFIKEPDFKKDLDKIEKINFLSYIFLFQSRYDLDSQNKEDKYIYHYTKKDTLEKILKSKEFYLTPSFTLNDPEEGTAFYNSIDLEKDKIINENDNLVFIQSFTKIEDNLPMYIMYTTEEKDNKNQMGYCIGYETSLFKDCSRKSSITNPKFDNTSSITNPKFDNNSKDLKMEELELIEVFYIDKNELINDLKSELKKDDKNELKKKILKKIIKLCNDYIDKENKGVLEEIKKLSLDCIDKENKEKEEIYKNLSKALTPILYIIKDKNYSHEKEIRLVYITSEYSDKKIEEDKKNEYCVKTDFKISKDINNKSKGVLNIICNPKTSRKNFDIDKIKIARIDPTLNIKMSSIKYQ